LIKKKKGLSEINLTNFLRRFAGFEALMKFNENKYLKNLTGLTIEDDIAS